MSQHRGLARIFQPPKSAMQSGRGKSHAWVLEYAPGQARELDPLMGWTGSGDTSAQVRLTFATREEAVDYAAEQGLEVTVTEPHKRKANVRPGGYGENFATNRRGAWTH